MKCHRLFYLTLLPALFYGESHNQAIEDLQKEIEAERKIIELLKTNIENEKQSKSLNIECLKTTYENQNEKLTTLTTEIDSLLSASCEVTCEQEPEPEARFYCSEMESYRAEINRMAAYARFDFLWWRVLENNLDYAIQDQPFSTSPRSAIGKYRSAKFDYDIGVKLALGFRFPPNFWEAEVQWTYFDDENQQITDGPDLTSNLELVGTFDQMTNARLSRAKSAIHLNLQMLDFTLGKRFFIQDYLMMKFFTGLSGAWIMQDWEVDYISNVNNNFLKFHWRFDGAGLKTGLHADWYLGRGFGIFTQVSGSGYVGSYKNDEQYTQQTTNNDKNRFQDSQFDDTRFVLNMQYLLGLDFGTTFSNGWNLNLFLGYEIQPWFNLHEVNRALFNTNSGSRDTRLSQGLLTLQGLTFKVEANF
ncbi:MAG: Lpg1974 family pore-forming outer membrane protein [Simkaniaceae bacterium]